ncbi:hypothetical protein PG997_005078 [Apiospora hydei]|uniref:Ubiquitin-like domain-containing protein n=1 Tax=Apiospora hydei TaxID=1337664 RepID=A0ABR1X3X9_9PEZI
MSSNDSDGLSASDIITYVGVPLAVAGILPITYSATSTLVYRAKVRKKLEQSQSGGRIRSAEIFNRVVEVQFPRYRLAAPDPVDGSSRCGIQQVQVYPRSGLPGGTWTFLTWNRQEIGTKAQRLTPGDEPVQPQAEIRFYELIECLYRLGAEADPSGWEELRTRGTWAPRGLVLMRFGSSDALLIIASDEPDGSLALQLGADVDWPSHQIQQRTASSDADSVFLRPVASKEHSSRLAKGRGPQDASLASGPGGKDSPLSDLKETQKGPSEQGESRTGTVHTLAILCRFSSEGLAQSEWHATSREDKPTSLSAIDTSHLCSGEGGSNQAMWFASCATAVQATKGQPIICFRIPDDICRFARTNRLPCGVLEILDMLEPSNIGSRENKTKTGQASRDIANSIEEKTLTTPRWPIQRVADCSLRWLQGFHPELADLSLQDVVVTVLYQMVVDPPFAASICGMLNQWREWTGIGHMRFEDMRAVREFQEIFAEASLLLALIDRLASDPREYALFNVQSCIETFKQFGFLANGGVAGPMIGGAPKPPDCSKAREAINPGRLQPPTAAVNQTPATQPPFQFRSPVREMLAAAAAEPDTTTMDHAPDVEEVQAEPPQEPIVGSSASGEVDQIATTGPSAGSEDELPPPSPSPPPDDSSSAGEQSVELSPADTDATSTTTTTTVTGDATSVPLPPPTEEEVEVPPAPLPQPQPVQPGDPRWAYSSDRPPAKLPIYFHDAVGRNYTFPWEKVKTWEGMERLIRACFAHVTPVTWWVNEGRYDLKVVEPNSAEASMAGAAPMTGIASQMFTTVPAPPPPPPPPGVGTNTSAGVGDGTGLQTQPLPVTPQQQPAAGTGAPFLQTVILPELWDELVVPGMTVTMTMWNKQRVEKLTRRKQTGQSNLIMTPSRLRRLHHHRFHTLNRPLLRRRILDCMAQGSGAGSDAEGSRWGWGEGVGHRPAPDGRRRRGHRLRLHRGPRRGNDRVLFE